MLANIASVFLMALLTLIVVLSGYIILVGDREEAEQEKSKNRSHSS